MPFAIRPKGRALPSGSCRPLKLISERDMPPRGPSASLGSGDVRSSRGLQAEEGSVHICHTAASLSVPSPSC